MGAKSAAQSNFSQTKSMVEQRRFLPVFGVRDDLMDVIRENNIVVVVRASGTNAADCRCKRLSAAPAGQPARVIARRQIHGFGDGED